MKFLTITEKNDPYLLFVKELYLTAFPKEERRDWQQLLDMIDTSGEMWLQVIEEDDVTIGFIIFWILEDWCFIEHLAVDAGLRGKRYGERIIKELMKYKKLLLEVEPPVIDDAIRRIGFYERFGFNTLPFPYLQPSYTTPGESFPMVLMTNTTEREKDQFSEIINLIMTKVYAQPGDK